MINHPKRRGPKSLSDILGELFTARGFSRLQARKELEDAWNAAVGEPAWRQTRLGEVRRGVLNVTVGNSALLEELAAFRKSDLLAALREVAVGSVIHDIRFRVGPLDSAAPEPSLKLGPKRKPNLNPNPSPKPAAKPKPKRKSP